MPQAPSAPRGYSASATSTAAPTAAPTADPTAVPVSASACQQCLWLGGPTLPGEWARSVALFFSHLIDAGCQQTRRSKRVGNPPEAKLTKGVDQRVGLTKGSGLVPEDVATAPRRGRPRFGEGQVIAG